MKNELDRIRVKLENINTRLVEEREILKKRLSDIDKDIQINQQLLCVLAGKDEMIEV